MFDYYSTPEGFKEANGYVIDGVWYPRVTKIVSIKSKPALYRFYAEQESFKASQEITEKSAAEGTLVHEAAEAILLGQKPEVDKIIEPAIKAFQKFIGEKNIQTSPEYVERQIFHPGHRYAGTIDVMALIDGKFGVLDIKTSQGIYRDYNLQTAAYMGALTDQFKHLQTRWILRIDQNQACIKCGATRRTKGGREKISFNKKRNGNAAKTVANWRTCGHEWAETQGEIEFQEFPYWESDFDAFLGAKRLWEWENESWLKRIGYLS
ncbi:MAG: hypothetical protein HY432_01190 [Candidatus Liptonbacteria bacterium]|nr:hypothetical protein [Candidatus Liptonbacteria bacterium]